MTRRLPADEPVATIEAVQTLVETASSVATRLAADPKFARLLGFFEALPAEDHDVILGVLERAVAMRLAPVDGADTVLGFRDLHPNPNARLYVRVVDMAVKDPPFVTRTELLRAVARAARIAKHVFQATPELPPAAQESLIAGFAALPEAELDALKRVLRDSLDLAEAAQARTRRND